MRKIISSAILVILAMASWNHSYGHQIDTVAIEDDILSLYGLVREQPDYIRAEAKHLLSEHSDAISSAYQSYLFEIIGDSYYMTSSYDSALHYFLEARVIMEDNDDSLSLAMNSTYLGEVYVEIGLHEEAAFHFFSAKDYYERVGDVHGLMDAAYGLSLLYYERGQFRHALNYATRILSLAREIGDSSTIPSTFTQISTCYLALQRVSQAESYAHKAIKYNRTYETGVMERAYALLAYADALNSQNRYNLAAIYLDSAEVDARSANDAYAIIFIKSSRALNLQARGLDNEAWAELESALSMCEELGTLAALRHSLKTGIAMSRYDQLLEKALFYSDSLESMNQHLLSDNFNYLSLSNELREERKRMRAMQQEMKIDDLTLERNTALLVMSIFVAFASALAWYFQFKANQKVRKMNEELEDRNKLISQQNKQLDEHTKVLTENQVLLKKSNADKDKLLALISHDLRSPVAQVKSVAELVLSGAIDQDELESFFTRINESADKSLANLTEVLVWARSQMDNGMSSNLEAVDAKKVMLAAYTIVESQYEKKEVTFTLKCSDEDHRVYCDESHLGIVLRNLLSNAVKFSHRGDEVLAKIRVDGAWVHFIVEDHGMGMPEEVRQAILDHGENRTNKGTEAESGTGTGLQLVREFTESNGGKLDIQSRLNSGTSVSVSFRKA